jgi:hypothetical protein
MGFLSKNASTEKAAIHDKINASGLASPVQEYV